jgi:hypothetical protein
MVVRPLESGPPGEAGSVMCGTASKAAGSCQRSKIALDRRPLPAPRHYHDSYRGSQCHHVMHRVECGIVGHPAQPTACLRRVGADGPLHTARRDFRTMYRPAHSRGWPTAGRRNCTTKARLLGKDGRRYGMLVTPARALSAWRPGSRPVAAGGTSPWCRVAGRNTVSPGLPQPRSSSLARHAPFPRI